MEFICYPGCSTCKKAQKWLDSHNITYTVRNIKENPPAFDELKEIYSESKLPLKKLFNTSGQVYRQMQLKDKLPSMSETEQLQLLASDGMLIKRPILRTNDTSLIGFKEAEWEEMISNE